jgi:hypothetical protein
MAGVRKRATRATQQSWMGERTAVSGSAGGASRAGMRVDVIVPPQERVLV